MILAITPAAQRCRCDRCQQLDRRYPGAGWQLRLALGDAIERPAVKVVEIHARK